jgi:hypothetical protein
MKQDEKYNASILESSLQAKGDNPLFLCIHPWQIKPITFVELMITHFIGSH